MSDKSAIEWTDATWNPVRARNKKTGAVGWHCEHATTGCELCYAEGFNKRLGTGLAFKPGHRAEIEIFLDDKMLTQPLRWKKPRMIFVGSMTDLFADFVTDEMLDRIFDVIEADDSDWDETTFTRRITHTYQILTKRAARMRAYITARFAKKQAYADQFKNCPTPEMRDSPAARWARTRAQPAWWTNIWLGVSTERQPEADERIPELLATPAAIRFISYEPALGPLDLQSTLGGTQWIGGQRGHGGVHRGDGSPGCPREPHHHHDERCGPGLDWVIAGGESGPKARPMHPDWARSLRDQCDAAGVKFFFKQWGAFYPMIDRDADDPDWRRDYSVARRQPGRFQILNLAGGQGFHGERVHLMQRYSKKSTGRLLDGVEHNAMPSLRRTP